MSDEYDNETIQHAKALMEDFDRFRKRWMLRAPGDTDATIYQAWLNLQIAELHIAVMQLVQMVSPELDRQLTADAEQAVAELTDLPHPNVQGEA